jgi:hypothetical protein
MFSRKAPDEAYHAAISRLQKAEASHVQQLDLLRVAKDEKKSNEVAALRRLVKESEALLESALNEAHAAWHCYWLERRTEIEPHLLAIAPMVREYDAISRVLRGSMAGLRPGVAFIEQKMNETPAPNISANSDVPINSPDSEALENYRGAWK